MIEGLEPKLIWTGIISATVTLTCAQFVPWVSRLVIGKRGWNVDVKHAPTFFQSNHLNVNCIRVFLTNKSNTKLHVYNLDIVDSKGDKCFPSNDLLGPSEDQLSYWDHLVGKPFEPGEMRCIKINADRLDKSYSNEWLKIRFRTSFGANISINLKCYRYSCSQYPNGDIYYVLTKRRWWPCKKKTRLGTYLQ